MSKDDTINSSGMKDCTGREYTEGDFVSFIRPFYHDQAIGKLIRFTPKCIKVLELKSEVDVEGKLVVKPQNYNPDHTVKPGNATIINETSAEWLYIPWADVD
jgi:hypothetical protein